MFKSGQIGDWIEVRTKEFTEEWHAGRITEKRAINDTGFFEYRVHYHICGIGYIGWFDEDNIRRRVCYCPSV